jgi:hypothetical protein
VAWSSSNWVSLVPDMTDVLVVKVSRGGLASCWLSVVVALDVSVKMARWFLLCFFVVTSLWLVIVD